VNSVKQANAAAAVLARAAQPDVVCLQETKLVDTHSTSCSAQSSPTVVTQLPSTARRSGTGWDPLPDRLEESSSESLAARLPTSGGACGVRDCGGVRIHSVYVPNGREPDSEHYNYKLAWLAALREMVRDGRVTRSFVAT